MFHIIGRMIEDSFTWDDESRSKFYSHFSAFSSYNQHKDVSAIFSGASLFFSAKNAYQKYKDDALEFKDKMNLTKDTINLISDITNLCTNRVDLAKYVKPLVILINFYTLYEQAQQHKHAVNFQP